MCECELTPEEEEQHAIFDTFSYFSRIRRLTNEQKNRMIKEITGHYVVYNLLKRYILLLMISHLSREQTEE